MKNISLAVALLVVGFFCGWLYGRSFSRNPSIVEYREQRIILEPGDAVCPQGDTCKWQAWDLDKNVPIEGR